MNKLKFIPISYSNHSSSAIDPYLLEILYCFPETISYNPNPATIINLGVVLSSLKYSYSRLCVLYALSTPLTICLNATLCEAFLDRPIITVELSSYLQYSLFPFLGLFSKALMCLLFLLN